MKNIRAFIKESVSITDMKNYLLNVLQNGNLDNKTLMKTYDVVAKATGQELAMAEPSNVNEFAEKRAIFAQYKKIRRAFREYDQLDLLYEIITNPNILPTSKDIFNKYSGNIITFFKNYTFELSTGEKVKMNPDLITELALSYAEKDKHGVARGDFEILCCLLLQDLNEFNNPGAGQSKGDINTGVMGSLEFKAAGGRLMGQTINSPELMDLAIKNILTKKEYKVDEKIYNNINKNNCGFFSTLGQIERLGDLLFELNLSDDDIIELLAQAVSAQFQNIRTDHQLKEIIQVITKNKKDFIQNNSLNAHAVSRLIGCIDLYFYQQVEKCNYMIVFSDKKDGRFVVLSKSIMSNIQQIYNNKDLSFDGNPRNSKNQREAAMKIHYK